MKNYQKILFIFLFFMKTKPYDGILIINECFILLIQLNSKNGSGKDGKIKDIFLNLLIIQTLAPIKPI